MVELERVWLELDTLKVVIIKKNLQALQRPRTPGRKQEEQY